MVAENGGVPLARYDTLLVHHLLCGGGRNAAVIAVKPQSPHRDELQIMYSVAAYGTFEPKHHICSPRNGATIADAISLSINLYLNKKMVACLWHVE